MAEKAVARELGGDDPVSQAGTMRADKTFKFTERPRPARNPPETSLSLLDGSFGPHDANYNAFGYHPNCKRDASRETTVGRLRDVGFRVEHTPRLPRSPLHVSVYWDESEWDDDVAIAFSKCFDSPKGGV